MSEETKNLTVSVRLSPKARFAAELLAIKLRSSMSDAIVYCIENGARQYLDERNPDLLDQIWHNEAFQRIWRLAQLQPAWLSLAEEHILKAIAKDPDCWKGETRYPDRKAEPDMEFIREHWQKFCSMGDPGRIKKDGPSIAPNDKSNRIDSTGQKSSKRGRPRRPSAVQ